MGKRFGSSRRRTAALALVGMALVGMVLTGMHAGIVKAAQAAQSQDAPASARSASDTAAVTLTDSQLQAIQVGAVGTREFLVQRQTVGNIDFDENAAVQVYTPYQGRILQTFADLGDVVRQGQILFTIESSDFIAAESTLIGAAAVLQQTNSALERAKKLYAVQGIDQNDYESAVANQQSAEGALRAARDAVAVFGKAPAQIDQIIAARQVENALVVKSPVNGRVTARNAAPGLLEQPGNPPAPFAVADMSTMWMLANVPEDDIPLYRVGQALSAEVAAYPGRAFTGKVTAVGQSVDPSTRRATLRSTIRDPGQELRAGMFATFTIRVGDPIRSPAVPVNGVVREGDGTMSVWVRGSDPHRFTRREVQIGLQQDGYDQVRRGLSEGEIVAVDGAILLSNIAFGGATD